MVVALGTRNLKDKATMGTPVRYSEEELHLLKLVEVDVEVIVTRPRHRSGVEALAVLNSLVMVEVMVVGVEIPTAAVPLAEVALEDILVAVVLGVITTQVQMAQVLGVRDLVAAAAVVEDTQGVVVVMVAALVFLARVQMVLVVTLGPRCPADADVEEVVARTAIRIVQYASEVEEVLGIMVKTVQEGLVEMGQFASSGQVVRDNSLQQILKIFSNEFQYQN